MPGICGCYLINIQFLITFQYFVKMLILKLKTFFKNQAFSGTKKKCRQYSIHLFEVESKSNLVTRSASNKNFKKPWDIYLLDFLCKIFRRQHKLLKWINLLNELSKNFRDEFIFNYYQQLFYTNEIYVKKESINENFLALLQWAHFYIFQDNQKKKWHIIVRFLLAHHKNDLKE